MSLSTEQIPLLETIKERRCDFGVIKVVYEDKPVILPLAKVDINASVVNQIAYVTQEQVFQNSFKENLEATYIFPLPGGAAVSSFEMKVGEKIIIGKVKERGEARQEYAEAVSQGKKAALMEQERDNVFTVQVGNIPSGNDIKVKITYSEKLNFFDNGTTEIRLPLVVAPRYNLGDSLEREQVGKGIDPDTDIVPDASRISPPRLAKGFDPKIDLNINVEIFQSDEQKEILGLSCSQHAIKTGFSNNKITVKLSKTNELLNRDFILNWQISQENLKNELVYYKDENDIYGMLTVIPPKSDIITTLPRDIVFVVDRSGSMEGLKMDSTVKACSILLDTLSPSDKFSILSFDDTIEWFNPNNINTKEKLSGLFVNSDESGLEQGNKFLREIKSRGGTEIDLALKKAIELINSEGKKTGRLPIIVILTDGQIGDESRVLKNIQKGLGDIRVFTIGIDTAVNESFLKRLATLGGGTSAFVTPGSELEDALKFIGREIGEPILIDLKISDESGDLIYDSIAPEKIPDLFSNRTVNLFFKTKKEGAITLTGKFNREKEFKTTVNYDLADIPAISQLWAKTNIFDLEDKFRVSESLNEGKSKRNKIKEEIIALSVKHSILTKFTAFIAVDQSIDNDSSKSKDMRKVIQPVSSVESWENNISMDFLEESFDESPKFLAQAPSPASAPMMRSRASFMPPSAPAAESMASFGGSVPGGIGGSQPIVSKKSAPKSFMNKFTEMITGGNKNKEEAAKKESVIKKSVNKNVTEAIKNLLSSFSNLINQLKSGVIPKTAEFEKFRNELTVILADDDIAMELSNLQRFLKSDSIEIITVLNSENINADSVVKKFEKFTAIIKNIKDEVQIIDNKEDEFWEANI